MQENGQDAGGTDEADNEVPDIEQAGTQGAPVGQFISDHRLGHYPPHENAGEEGAGNEKDIGSEKITEVEEALAEHREVDRATRQGAEHADDTGADRLNDGAPLARDVQFLIKHSRAYLMHGDGGGEGGQRQEGIEEDGDDISQGGREGLLKHIGQGDEDERGATVRIDTHREGSRENHQTGQNSHEGVESGYLPGRLHQVSLPAEVAGISAETGRAQGEGEEGLAQGVEEDLLRQLAEVRMKEEDDALAGIGQQTGGRHDDQQQHKERGHEQIAEPLYPLAHAPDDHEVGEQDKGNSPDDGQGHTGRELLEVAGHIGCIAMELAHNGSEEILQAPSRNDSVKAKDDGGGDHAHIANQRPPAAANDLVGLHGIGGAVTPHHKLGYHAGYAQQEHAHKIDADESGTTVLARHIGEAPDVAQAHCRAGSGEDDAKFGSKVSAFGHSCSVRRCGLWMMEQQVTVS